MTGLDALADPHAAVPLAKELQKLGCADDAALSIDDALVKKRALFLFGHYALETARCLFRCGDHEGLARKTLETFANDVRGPIALHARSVLDKVN